MPVTRRRVRLIVISAALIAVVWMFAHAGTALVVSMPVDAPDAIVSLASHEWERLPATARAAAAHPAAIVLLTIPQDVTIHTCHRCADRVADLAREGVESRRVRMIPLTRPGTYGEAVGVLEFAKAASIRRLLIVTSPYHARRSLAAFRDVFAGHGIELGVKPALETSTAAPRRWWLHGYDLAYVAYEWAATAYYAVKYGVWPL